MKNILYDKQVNKKQKVKGKKISKNKRDKRQERTPENYTSSV